MTERIGKQRPRSAGQRPARLGKALQILSRSVALALWMAGFAVAQPCDWTPAGVRANCSGMPDMFSVWGQSGGSVLLNDRGEKKIGAHWVPQGAGIYIGSAVSWSSGSASRAFVGGRFPTLSSGAAVAEWTGSGWTDPGCGLTSGTRAPRSVTALHVHDDGSGEALYIAGRLLHPSIPRTGNPILVRWNGVSVTHVADADAPVEDMVTYDDGTGPKLVVTGHFSSIGGVAANGIAAWDGGTWSPLGHGLLDIFGSPTGDALVVLSDPSGDILFAGGEIFTAGGQFRAGVVQWDGNAWSLTGTILYNGNHPRGVAYVRSLVLFDTGFGPQVHVSGSFDAPVIGIGRWDGTAWRSLGAGYQYSGSTCVVHDDGAGPALYVPAWQIDGLEVCSAARWSCPPRPTPLVRQDTPGYGSRVWLDNSGLTPGAEYYNVISTELCAGPLPGSGPLLGLCASDPAVLMAQVLTPVGTPPFHFIAPTSRSTFGPYTLPPVQVECLLMEWRFGVLWQISDIQRASVQ